MSYNGKLLAKARAALEARREENLAEQRRRTEAVYRALPEVKRMDAALRSQMAELCGLVVRRADGSSGEIQALEKANLELQAARAEKLTGGGFPIDYTDEIYTCPICRDSGMDGGRVCSCLTKLYNTELTRELGSLLRCGDESFDKFDLNLYGTEIDPKLGVSPRECMRDVLGTCRRYAESFGRGSGNLLFQGGTGLGKTFLSACIARLAAEKGFSVAYESCGAALEAFESAKFSRDGAESEAAATRTRQYRDCDLMILDDLGTEMSTSFSVASLYQIINSRLIAGRSSIISTNLSWDELSRRYGAQISSRLDGEYLLLPFIGRDIRIIKKERGE